MRFVPSINFVMAALLGLLLLFTHPPVFSQPTELQLKKFSLPLQKKWTATSANESSVFIIATKDTRAFKNTIASDPQLKIVYEYPSTNVLLLRAKWSDVLKIIAPNNEVLFIDEQRIPKEERAVSDLDLSADKVNVLFSKYPQYNGNNLVVSVKENRPDTEDIDFQGRYVPTTLTSNIFSTHATDMASIIAGAGNSYYEGKGPAWGSTITSSNFAILLPDPEAAYQQYNITVQNHSYGTSIENFYGADAAAYDASVITRPSLIHVFSAGNSGMQTSTSGTYANVPAFANITGSFKMAKNIITVGHMDSLQTVLAPSSRGPAYDGRVKPELVAYAEDGSSGAAAIVSGISLNLQQAYKDLHGVLPSSALVKAVLLNSADDVGPKGIDFTSGYGAANAYKAMLEIANGQYFNGSIAHDASDTYNLVVPPNIKQLKITLVWNDPPAAANAAKALINDLDLELWLPVVNQFWQPWVLNHFPQADSIQMLSVRKRDSLNNVEQVSIENPAAGNYEIRVKGYNVATSSQTYSVAYQFDTLNKFRWYYPTRIDNIFNGRSNILRWESTYNISTSRLQYSSDNGNTWQLIDDAVVLPNGYFKWTAPDNFSTAILRMNLSSQNFVSDTFTISKRFDVLVGFNCPDSFMLFWNKISGVDSFQVYRLGEKYMQPLLTTVDTAVVLAKQTNPSLYYAVAPLIKNKTGLRSYAYNYTTQGVACYVRTLLGQLVATSAKLDLELGTSYNVKSITWQKLTTNGYMPLETIQNISGLTYGYIDNSLTHGLNIYRVKIELADGRIVNSETVTVYFAQEPYIVYPNPVPQYHPLTLISNDPDIAQLEVFNMLGQKVFEKTLNDFSNTIPTDRFSKGIYLLRVLKDNQPQATLKLIVY
jgi:Subtilase family/Secretion system C-terminal sorting domain